MIQFLPTGGFIFISPHQIGTRFPVANINETVCALSDDGEKGYILEIDVEYPEEFHDNHSDYPEILEISRGLYSPLRLAKFPVDRTTTEEADTKFKKQEQLYCTLQELEDVCETWCENYENSPCS